MVVFARVRLAVNHGKSIDGGAGDLLSFRLTSKADSARKKREG